MARSVQQTLKLLYLKDFLSRYTDEDHPATTPEILSYLASQGISAERKTLYTDMQALMDYGLDIVRTPGHRGWFLGARDFELAELKLLVDAVQSSKFLSERKSLELICKLETLASTHEAGTLRRQVVVTGRVKSMNESIYYNVDLLHQAIAENSRIRFRYFEWGLDKQKVFRGGVREASPYALIWDSENYYLLCHTQAHGLTHFRVDKMAGISLTGEARVQTEQTEHLDLAGYGKQVFGMYHGEPVNVRLRFENSLSGVVIDRFGKDQSLIPDGADHFTVTAQIQPSPVFYGWLLSFGRRVQIQSPQSVQKEYKTLLQSTLEQYEG